MPLVALSTELSQKLKATEGTNKAIKRCLDYLITFPNGTITCAAFDMVLWAHSDVANLEEDGTKSRVEQVAITF